MGLIDIIILIVGILIVILIISYFIYKKFKKEPIGDCRCCANKGNKLVKGYHKKYKK